jgi:hypothetical protein
MLRASASQVLNGQRELGDSIELFITAVRSKDTMPRHFPQSVTDALVGSNGPQIIFKTASKSVRRQPSRYQKQLLEKVADAIPVELQCPSPRANVREHVASEFNEFIWYHVRELWRGFHRCLIWLMRRSHHVLALNQMPSAACKTDTSRRSQPTPPLRCRNPMVSRSPVGGFASR